MKGSITFLDLASVTGWCEGAPGENPISGSIRLAPEGSKSPAVMGGMIKFLGGRLQGFKPKTLVYEAPFMSKLPNHHTTMITWGLCGVVEGVCDRMGVYDVQKANLNSIRKTVMGYCPRGKTVKQEVMAFVRTLGYAPQDDNEADALMGWLYSCHTLAGTPLPNAPTPLF